MINVNMLKYEVVKNCMTQKDFCNSIGMSQSTFIRKMKRGVFKTDEIEKMINVLKLEKPQQIFFGMD